MLTYERRLVDNKVTLISDMLTNYEDFLKLVDNKVTIIELLTIQLPSATC